MPRYINGETSMPRETKLTKEELDEIHNNSMIDTRSACHECGDLTDETLDDGTPCCLSCFFIVDVSDIDNEEENDTNEKSDTEKQ
jgi:hypothetical protein